MKRDCAILENRKAFGSPLSTAFSAALGAALLSGCAGDVTTSPPELELRERFINAPGGADVPASGVEGEDERPNANLPKDWWTRFDDPALTALIEQALSENLDLEIAAARLEEAAFALVAAKAQLGPQISGDAQAAVQRLSLENPQLQLVGDLPGFDRVVELYGLNAGAQWEIDLFGRLRAQKRAALAQYASAQAQRDFARLTIAAEVTRTYLTLTELSERLVITRDQISAIDRLNTLTELNVSRGITAPVESDRTRAELEGLKAAVPALELGIETARYRLSVLLGKAPEAELLGSDALNVPSAPQMSFAGTPATLLRSRPDIVAAERDVAAASARVQQTIAERYPRLSLSGFIGFLAGDPGALFGDRSLQAAGSADVSVPLFTSGQLKAGEGAARARLRQAVAQYRLTALSAIAEAESALLGLEKQSEVLGALERAALSITSAASRTERARAAGVADLIDVLDVERRALEARDRVVIARADAARQALEAFRSLGGGYEPYPQELGKNDEDLSDEAPQQSGG